MREKLRESKVVLLFGLLLAVLALAWSVLRIVNSPNSSEEKLVLLSAIEATFGVVFSFVLVYVSWALYRVDARLAEIEEFRDRAHFEVRSVSIFTGKPFDKDEKHLEFFLRVANKGGIGSEISGGGQAIAFVDAHGNPKEIALETWDFDFYRLRVTPNLGVRALVGEAAKPAHNETFVAVGRHRGFVARCLVDNELRGLRGRTVRVKITPLVGDPAWGEVLIP